MQEPVRDLQYGKLAEESCCWEDMTKLESKPLDLKDPEMKKSYLDYQNICRYKSRYCLILYLIYYQVLANLPGG